jgi:hypothetical protein
VCCAFGLICQTTKQIKNGKENPTVLLILCQIIKIEVEKYMNPACLGDCVKYQTKKNYFIVSSLW